MPLTATRSSGPPATQPSTHSPAAATQPSIPVRLPHSLTVALDAYAADARVVHVLVAVVCMVLRLGGWVDWGVHAGTPLAARLGATCWHRYASAAPSRSNKCAAPAMHSGPAMQPARAGMKCSRTAPLAPCCRQHTARSPPRRAHARGGGGARGPAQRQRTYIYTQRPVRSSTFRG